MTPPVKTSVVGPLMIKPATREEALAYIGAMLVELHRMALHHRRDTLAYILEMARLEVEMRG